MIAYRNDNIDAYLQQVRIAVKNSKDVPEIAAALALYGHDAVKTDEGAALLAIVEELQAVQKQEYSEQYAATTAVKEAWSAVDKTYTTHRKIARLALRSNPNAQTALMLHEQKARTLNPWIGQAGVFYKNARRNPDVIAALTTYNITDVVLTDAQTAVSHLADLDADQEQEKSEARNATRSRNAALDALDEWYSEFRTLARIALADDPQRLEALGLGSAA